MSHSAARWREIAFFIAVAALVATAVAAAQAWHDRAQSASALRALLASGERAVPLTCPFDGVRGAVIDLKGARLGVAQKETPRYLFAAEPCVYLASLYYRRAPAAQDVRTGAVLLAWRDAKGAVLRRVPFPLGNATAAALGGVVQEAQPFVLPHTAATLSLRLLPAAQEGEALLAGCILLIKADA